MMLLIDIYQIIYLVMLENLVYLLRMLLAIKDAGGISVYAHPNLTDKNFNDLREMKEIGLDGIEVSSQDMDYQDKKN